MIGPERFAGRWALNRVIEDARAGQVLRGRGQAVIAGQGDGLVYREALELEVPGQGALRGERCYLWRWRGAEVEVRFDDGRPFHRFRAAGRDEGTDHPCGADLYRVVYDFTAFPRWEAVWSVTGPRKDYVSRTVYRPN